jgi:hypothetical protein
VKSAPLVTAWWPLARKVRQALVAYLGVEGAAVVGELTTGTPGWSLVLAGAIPGAIALAVAYLTRDESSPPL